MIVKTLLIYFFLVLPQFIHAQSIQQSHLESNIPDANNFYAFLKRDLLEYFKANISGTTDELEFELLRKSPTQSGTSYPKYYAWVKAKVGATQIEQGVIRLEAIDKVRFKVTHFISATNVNQKSIESIFPSNLITNILERAKK